MRVGKRTIGTSMAQVIDNLQGAVTIIGSVCVLLISTEESHLRWDYWKFMQKAVLVHLQGMPYCCKCKAQGRDMFVSNSEGH